jgi:hypothetical protein
MSSEYYRQYYLANKDKINARNKERYDRVGKEEQKSKRAELREAVYDHYGRICACCGETEILFLSIYHVNNDGNKQGILTRRRDGTQYRTHNDLYTYRDIIARNFPDDYQVLCMNCNWGKHRNGGVCPHKEEIDC